MAAENAKSLLEEMSKKSEENKASCHRERDEIQEQIKGCERSSAQQHPHKRRRTDKSYNSIELALRMNVRV